MDMEKFYNECIPKECLPKDYGGDCETINELHDKHCEEFKRLRPYFWLKKNNHILNLTNVINLI